MSRPQTLVMQGLGAADDTRGFYDKLKSLTFQKPHSVNAAPLVPNTVSTFANFQTYQQLFCNVSDSLKDALLSQLAQQLGLPAFRPPDNFVGLLNEPRAIYWSDLVLSPRDSWNLLNEGTRPSWKPPTSAIFSYRNGSSLQISPSLTRIVKYEGQPK